MTRKIPLGVMNEIRATDSGDAWGNALNWWFVIADEIYFNRPALHVPAEWRFRPSPLGPQNDPGDYASGVVVELDDALLKRLGAFCNRYCRLLKHLGKDY